MSTSDSSRNSLEVLKDDKSIVAMKYDKTDVLELMFLFTPMKFIFDLLEDMRKISVYEISASIQGRSRCLYTKTFN